MRRIALVLACAAAAAGCGAEAEREAAPPPEQREEERVAKLPPLPDEGKARVVDPKAGESVEERVAVAGAEVEEPDPGKPTAPASGANRRMDVPDAIDGSIDRATALPNGVALPPLEAPQAVLEVIKAGNSIARTPYKWGGGHGRFVDDGYDCSGSVSYALYSAGLIEGPRTSGGLLSWGKPGKGRWITIWTHDGHVFMEVAGIRFDTTGRAQTGSRWQNAMRSTAGFTPRHPPGL